MSRWLLVLCLTVASATGVAWAQPAVTDRAETQAQTVERKVAELAVKRQKLVARYEDELRAIDKLKKQRASWRRDREIQSSMSASLETANQLAAVTRELATADQALASARRALIVAVDAERPTATGVRAQKLDKLRNQLAPRATRIQKIKIPGEPDPLADPEELDEAAQQMRETEAELQRQITGLEAQAKELDRVAVLRRQHERASELGTRDDDAPNRNAPRPVDKGGRGGAETLSDNPAPAPQSGTPPNQTGGIGDSNTPKDPAAPYESEATVVLSDVVDASTIDSLQRAQRSGDPAVRAAAAKQARDAVAARLAKLKQQRSQIESRAKTLRGSKR